MQKNERILGNLEVKESSDILKKILLRIRGIFMNEWKRLSQDQIPQYLRPVQSCSDAKIFAYQL